MLAPEVDLRIYVAGESDLDPLRELLVLRRVFTEDEGPDITIAPQVGDSLGDRLMNAFADSFEAGYHHVIVVGSDQPMIPTQYLLDAFASLNDHDVTIGPADDGGYFALGLKARRPELFIDMPWSTPKLFDRTIESVQALGLRLYKLPVWYDVDDGKALRWLLDQTEILGPRVMEALASMGNLFERLQEKEA